MLKDLMLENRTCRTFDESRKICREELTYMIECARLAPSMMNAQPLRYRLVYTPDELAAIQPLTKWGAALPELQLPPEGHHPTAFIVVCQDISKYASLDKFRVDVGLVSLAISLCAAEMGFASCIIESFDHEKLPKALGIDENLKPQVVIGIGKPDEVRKVVDVKDDSVKYYRDADGVHCVPKRSLEDLLV
ncbi:MAG: nitroreductase [Clostridiales bacterium]|nr:nitroreductase [Clostridiales bacterium]